jgi:hypothetical protein
VRPNQIFAHAPDGQTKGGFLTAKLFPMLHPGAAGAGGIRGSIYVFNFHFLVNYLAGCVTAPSPPHVAGVPRRFSIETADFRFIVQHKNAAERIRPSAAEETLFVWHYCSNTGPR